jgi:hypothetical protein
MGNKTLKDNPLYISQQIKNKGIIRGYQHYINETFRHISLQIKMRVRNPSRKDCALFRRSQIGSICKMKYFVQKNSDGIKIPQNIIKTQRDELH